VSEPEPFFQGFLDDYFAECDEHLAGATRALLALEASLGTTGTDRVLIDELFRDFHSLKGISAMVELRPAEQLAHHLEDYLGAIRDRKVTLTAAGIDVLIDGTQRLEQVVNAYRSHQPPPSIDDVAARIEAIAPRPVKPDAGPDRVAERRAPEPSLPRWRCTFVPTRELLARGVGVDNIRKRLTEIGTIIDAVPHVRPDGTIAFQFTLETAAADAIDALLSDGVVVEPIDSTAVVGDAPGAVRPPGAGSTAAPTHIVRVDLMRLDQLMQNVGDLVISRSRLTEALTRLERHVPSSEWRSVQENIVAIDRQLRTLREGIMRIRLVPIGEIFRRMPFVVRDLARESGKKITLDLQGQGTEIDKYLIEQMLDPVLHLVRNAVSHGIETPDVRIANGKRPEGTITLSAFTSGETVTIEVADDGRGVDAAAVAARARAAGLPVPADTLDGSALLALLCSSGFSTNDEADRASGRGVGMSVVKSTVEQLSGTVTMTTEPGGGTRFTVELPLTLAITDALIGRVGAEVFALPQGAVQEVIEVTSSDVRLVERNEIIPYRRGALPIVRLARLFGIDSAVGERFHVFVVGRGAAAVGLAVDRIIGQREIVVRAINDPLARVDGISGATDLGDGRVVLILDPGALATFVRTREARAVGAVGDWGRLQA